MFDEKMKRTEEKSFGIIPLKKEEGRWKVLLIKHQTGHWAFPKGHPDEGESPIETATRELKEETSLKIVDLISETPLQENYIFKRKDSLVYKAVDYFLAVVGGGITIQADELADYEWVDLFEAKMKITFPEGKNLCTEAEKKLSSEV